MNRLVSKVYGALVVFLFVGCGPGPRDETQADPSEVATEASRALNSDSGEGTVKKGKSLMYGPIDIQGGTRVEAWTHGDGDVDLALSWNERVSNNNIACNQEHAGSSERCELTAPASAKSFYLRVYGYAQSSKRRFGSYSNRSCLMCATTYAAFTQRLTSSMRLKQPLR